MAIGTAVASPLLDSGRLSKYRYRYRMGMVPSEEHLVIFEDFVNDVASNVPAGGLWEAAIIDTGATCLHNQTATTGATGTIALTDATASEGISIYTNKQFQLISGKKFYAEMRFRTDDVTDNAVQFGLTDLTATTNPEDLWTTTAANLVTFGILDGSAYPQMLADKSNSGTTVQTQTNKILVADTWHTMAIAYNGSQLEAYVDGDKALTWSSAASTIPTATAMSLFIGHLNGNGAGGNTTIVDYVRVVSER